MREQNPIVITSLALILILAMPVLVPSAIIAGYFRMRRLRTAAEKSVCPECGHALGVEALRLADERWQTHPGIRFRMIRQVHAICTHCQTSLSFCEDSGGFTKTEPMESNLSLNPDTLKRTRYFIR